MSWGLHDVSVSYGDHAALDGVDCLVGPGAVEAVIGPDGAGKSTLARALVGLVDVAAGTVNRPPRDRLGYQPEGAGTWGELTVTENLQFVAATNRLADQDRLAELLAVTRLHDAADRLAANLSGGMRQKLAVAMAMLASPQLLVLDEPTTGLDPVSRADVWRLLVRAADEGAAIVVTTSYLDEAQRADHVVVLDDGVPLVTGTATEIRDSFTGVLTAEQQHDPRRLAWRRGRTWRTWYRRGQQVPDDAGPRLDPDLSDVVMAASIVRREATP